MNKIFLHVGCGKQVKSATTREFAKDHWDELRYDIDKEASPDIVGTMTDMNMVSDDHVDAVYSSHNIEHLYPHEVPIALGEFYRVTKKRGFVVITCPDIRSVCELVVKDQLNEPAYISPAGPIAPLDMMYGHRASLERGNLYMAHRTAFTEKTLTSSILQAGFAKVATMRGSSFDLWALAVKTSIPDSDMNSLAVDQFPQR
jgi:predicted SAM-dependent methyltransferase